MKAKEQLIQFHFLVNPFYFPNRTGLKRYILQQLKNEGKEVEGINYIFCTDDYLLDINQQYLQHNTLTDIITFELSPPRQPLLSDIYISIERVRENAALFQSTFSKELHRVIFHGALHLAGYKDKLKSEKTEMERMENKWLNSYFVPRDTVSL